MSRLAQLPVSIPKTTLPLGIDLDSLGDEFTKILNDDIQCRYFVSDAVWRDNYALTGTLRTFYGNEAISAAWNDRIMALKAQSFKYLPQFTRNIKLPDGSSWVDIYFEFETSTLPKLLCTAGLSIVYIAPDSKDTTTTTDTRLPKIWVIKTVLDKLKEAPSVDTLQPKENASSRPPFISLHEKKEDSHYFDCVIVGAGQAGLNTAGRCEAQGISYVVLEQKKQIGDNWRLRYKSTRLHTVREYAHLPFERTFGDDYQEFLTKDDLADGYAQWTKKYGINVWLETSLKLGTWDAQNKKWTLRIERKIPGKETMSIEVLTCSFVIMCVGAGGQVPVLPTLAGRENYQGTALHSGEYDSPEAWAGKHGVVVGAANTAHDVAEDMVAAGLSFVTMIQKRPTFVLPVEWYKVAQDMVYNAQIPTALSDKFSFIGPHAVQRLVSQSYIHNLVRHNWDQFEALEKAGFRVDAFGDPHFHLNERLGGHYMDVGASEKIRKGIIKVKSNATLTHYTPSGLGFTDGTELPADLIVFATGFDLNIQGRVRELFGDRVAEQVGPFSYMNDEGELEGAWKFNHPGLACNGGAIGPSRWYSRFLALHMKAILAGTPLIMYSG
ncbi:flavin-containing monooxygenase [Aspergillus californicus]